MLSIDRKGDGAEYIFGYKFSLVMAIDVSPSLILALIAAGMNATSLLFEMVATGINNFDLISAAYEIPK
jgi:hypothetical protein